jgi:hypothetical protein
MNIRVIAHPAYEFFDRLLSAAESANRCQRFFHFAVERERWVPNHRGGRAIGVRSLVREITQRLPGERSIVITASDLKDDGERQVAYEARFAAVVSTYAWKAENEPPALATYFLFHLASAATNFAADLHDDTIKEFAHDPAIGCLFDWYKDYEELRRCMVAATICAQCEGNLAGMELPGGAMTAVEALLDRVRRVTIRRARDLPTRIFLGHGGESSTWRLVQEQLEELGLVVEEFNSEAVAGEHVIDRLEDMLGRSVFAVLVFSAEDTVEDPSATWTQARQNVIHEAGLCQGRLGFRRVVLLVEEGTKLPSNLHGLQNVPYEGNDLSGAIASIRKTLVREGLIQPGNDKDGEVELLRPRSSKRRPKVQSPSALAVSVGDST